MTQTVGTGEEQVHFPLPGWFGESHPICREYHRKVATCSPDRLVAGDLLHL